MLRVPTVPADLSGPRNTKLDYEYDYDYYYCDCDRCCCFSSSKPIPTATSQDARLPKVPPCALAQRSWKSWSAGAIKLINITILL